MKIQTAASRTARNAKTSIALRSVLIALGFLRVATANQQTGLPDSSVDIRDRNQVFIDGRYLQSAENVRIVACPPRKTYERCLASPSAMRGGWLQAYATILPVDGVFRGFHALSKNGADWRQVNPGTAPEPDDLLGLYNGQSFPFADPTAAPEQRYKLFNPFGNSISVSRDGAKWEVFHEGIFPGQALYPRGMDSHNSCFYDTRLDKYVAYVRVNKGYPAPSERQAYFNPLSSRNYGREGLYVMRAVGRSVTDDLAGFPMPKVVFQSDEKDPHFGGVSVTDSYIPNVVEYAHAQDAYYLFDSRYLHYEDWFLSDDFSDYGHHTFGQKQGPLNAGPIDIGLAASRDGIDWHRFDRKPWIGLGPEGGFDTKHIYMCTGIFNHGNEIWMYYLGGDGLHGGPKQAEGEYVVSRVVMQKDRFTAVEADYTGGEFTTCQVRFEGQALHLNIETSALGLARVEIQDADAAPIEGYRLEDCDRVHTANTVDRVVTWRGGESDVSELAGKPIRLRFELQFGARLYAFRFGIR